jgi:tetratricopeptide (TPR) repeat protein
MIEDESVRDVAQRLGDPLATVLAAQSETGAADTRAYLREQTRLARLQSENLIEQNAFEISHLKWRRVGDRIRGVGHFILVLLGLLVIVAFGAAIWTALNDHRLVVESFSVPPALAEQGQTGNVVAQHVLDRIVAMQNGTQSLRAANSYRNNWGDDLKVQIPDTGVSLGEVYRFLVSWLGRQTHITGEVVRSAGGFAVTARAGAGAGITVHGNDLDALPIQIAERLFGETQPYRYGIYLSSHRREPESKAVLLALAQSDAPTSERAWAYSGLLFVENDTRRSEQYGNAAVALNPDLLLAHNNLSAVAWRLGHSELAYREAGTGLKLLNDDAGVELDQRVLGNMHSVLAEEVDAALGDYAGAVREMRADIAIERAGLRTRSQAFLIRDLALMHDLVTARRIMIDPLPPGSTSTANRQLVLTSLGHGLLDIEANNWIAAKIELSKATESLGPHYASFQLQAQLAFVLAKLGDVSSARAFAATLRPDCYPCVVAGAKIEAISRDWRAADALFSDAVQLGPSLPFAYADWGAMLLTRGKYDAAIAKFTIAHEKGPHFADPLEMWGEALIEKNRSDLALGKFEEADKYAPNWGRLHLEWGKAFLYTGNRAEAQKQLVLAARLDLSAADAAALVGLRGQHV